MLSFFSCGLLLHDASERGESRLIENKISIALSCPALWGDANKRDDTSLRNSDSDQTVLKKGFESNEFEPN